MLTEIAISHSTVSNKGKGALVWSLLIRHPWKREKNLRWITPTVVMIIKSPTVVMVMRAISIESVKNLTFRHNFGSLGPSGKCWHVGPQCGHQRTKIVMLTKTMETIPPLTIKMGALIQEPGFTGKLREKTNWLYHTTLYTGTLLREVFIDNMSTMVNIKFSGYHQLQGIAVWLPGRFIRFSTLKLQTNSKNQTMNCQYLR